VPVTRVDLARWIAVGRFDVAASVVEVRGLEALRFGSTLIYALPHDERGRCLYLVDGRCSIYKVKPLVCDIFPFAYDHAADRLDLHPWALARCEAIAKGFSEVRVEERGRLLAEARTVSRELRRVDEVKGEYEQLIEEARRRAGRTLNTLSARHKPSPFLGL